MAAAAVVAALAWPNGIAPSATPSPVELTTPSTPAPTPALSDLPSPTDSPSNSFSPTVPPPAFDPIDLFAAEPAATPEPRLYPLDGPGDAIFEHDKGRPIPAQSVDWLTSKAYGRVALVEGKLSLLASGAYPLFYAGTRNALPPKLSLDVTWTRWIVEPPGSGRDDKGNSYYDLSYWNMCGPGAATVVLYYWQQLTGHPNVTGMSGYFLEPYVASGSHWPNGGPSLPSTKGTYWLPADSVSGYTTHARGFLMYMAMSVKPAGWTSPGVDIWVDAENRPRYPTFGAPPRLITAGLNWEVSGHDATNWVESYYTITPRWDPQMARDLNVAVMMDLARDGVPVVVSADTAYLPNWQAGSSTPHIRHAITIVAYDNTANPPTYTYLDTCGRGCNNRSGNRGGQLHVITQANMVKAITLGRGMGFIW